MALMFRQLAKGRNGGVESNPDQIFRQMPGAGGEPAVWHRFEVLWLVVWNPFPSSRIDFGFESETQWPPEGSEED